MGFEIFEALDHDWTLIADGHSARDACRRWSADAPLTGCVTLHDVVARTKRGTDPGDADAVLGALARRSPTDAMAARTLLQCLIPGMVKLARRHGAPVDAEAAGDVVGIALERIRSYPYDRRPRAIAANVLLDTHQRLCRDRNRRPVPMEDFVVDPASVDETSAARDVIDLVQTAVRRRVLALDEAKLVLRPVVSDHDADAEAAELGIKTRSLARRRQRAMRRLVEFAQAELTA